MLILTVTQMPPLIVWFPCANLWHLLITLIGLGFHLRCFKKFFRRRSLQKWRDTLWIEEQQHDPVCCWHRKDWPKTNEFILWGGTHTIRNDDLSWYWTRKWVSCMKKSTQYDCLPLVCPYEPMVLYLRCISIPYLTIRRGCAKGSQICGWMVCT